MEKPAKENDSYLELGLPEFLVHSINQLIEGRKKVNSGIHYTVLDMDWDELNADIGIALSNGDISSKQADYLRNKYLL